MKSKPIQDSCIKEVGNAATRSLRTSQQKKEAYYVGLMGWWKTNRIEYPWRGLENPWLVLLTEILLRKTNAEKVSERIGELMERLSTPQALLLTPPKELQRILEPFGMQIVKARELRELAAILVRDYGGSVPDNFAELSSLPGVGAYISNAVLCFGFGRRQAVLDTNIIRVQARFFGLASNRKRPRTDPSLWSHARSLLPSTHADDYNWALLDFGKLICRARNPRCSSCPLSASCTYYQSAIAAQGVQS